MMKNTYLVIQASIEAIRKLPTAEQHSAAETIYHVVCGPELKVPETVETADPKRERYKEAYALRENGKTFAQIGEAMGVSGSRARQLVMREKRFRIRDERFANAIK